jgi:hypothetical protein
MLNNKIKKSILKNYQKKNKNKKMRIKFDWKRKTSKRIKLLKN